MSEQRSENPRRTPSADGRRGDRLVVLLVVTFLAFVNYAALLSVVPLWASEGGAASVVVGATTGVMMAATVGTQLAMPWLFALFRLRTMMVFGAVLLGAPTPLYALSTEVVPIMAITVVRGIGFAFVVVAGATLVADLAPEGRLSTAASYYGAAAALPNLAALAGGVWTAQTWGFPSSSEPPVRPACSGRYWRSACQGRTADRSTWCRWATCARSRRRWCCSW